MKEFVHIRNTYVFWSEEENGAFHFGLGQMIWAEIGHNGPEFHLYMEIKLKMFSKFKRCEFWIYTWIHHIFFPKIVYGRSRVAEERSSEYRGYSIKKMKITLRGLYSKRQLKYIFFSGKKTAPTIFFKFSAKVPFNEGQLFNKKFVIHFRPVFE